MSYKYVPNLIGVMKIEQCPWSGERLPFFDDLGVPSRTDQSMIGDVLVQVQLASARIEPHCSRLEEQCAAHS